MCRNYYMDCNCTVKASCSHRGTEATLWETAKERKVYCTVCGNIRIVRKRVVCTYKRPVCNRVCNRVCVYNKPVVRDNVYVVFL